MLRGMSSLFSPSLLREAQALLTELGRRGLKVATAESCTGGLLMGLLTEIPGASAVVDRGFITYSNEAKAELLGIDPALIAQHGAVSPQVACAMAEGALGAAPVGLAIAVTGIAGPDGGSADKPVGLVYLSAALRGHDVSLQEFRFGGIGRSQIRLATLREAVTLARGALSSGSAV